VRCSIGCTGPCYNEEKPRWPFLTQIEFTKPARSKVELFLDESKLEEVLRRREPTLYFWCDMTDMFLEDYPDDWIDRFFETMRPTPQHRHMADQAGRGQGHGSASRNCCMIQSPVGRAVALK
jgi:hypothetical protein